jgi:hypothetical protein
MSLSQNMYFSLVSITLLYISHLYSIKFNIYQTGIHILSLYLLFIMITFTSDTHTSCTNKTVENTVKNKNIAQCLQNQCHKAANEYECQKYKRCKWNKPDQNKPEKCTINSHLCENMTNKQSCDEQKTCSWDNDKCSWKRGAEQEDIDIDTLYDAEILGFNKTCLKKTSYKTDSSFVQDQRYVHCIDACTAKNGGTGCKNECKTNSVNKIECESVDGYKYDVLKDQCNKFYNTTKVTDAIEKKPNNKHDHVKDIQGYNRSKLFQSGIDYHLVNIFKCFIILIVFLLNINCIKILNNLKSIS